MAALSFTGKYKLESSENLSEFLKEAGVGMIRRNLMASLSPPVEIEEDGNTYTMKVITPMKTWELKFELDKEFSDKTIVGKDCQSVVRREGNILTRIQKQGIVEIKTLREITSDGKLIVTTTMGDVTCKRIYKREQ